MRWCIASTTCVCCPAGMAGAGTSFAQATHDSMLCAARAHFLSLTSAAMTRRDGSGAQVGGPKHQGDWVPAGCQQRDAGFSSSWPYTGPAQQRDIVGWERWRRGEQ